TGVPCKHDSRASRQPGGRRQEKQSSRYKCCEEPVSGGQQPPHTPHGRFSVLPALCRYCEKCGFCWQFSTDMFEAYALSHSRWLQLSISGHATVHCRVPPVAGKRRAEPPSVIHTRTGLAGSRPHKLVPWRIDEQ